MTKNDEKLQVITNEIKKCHICKIDSVGNPVVGEGSSNAQLMFVGEAPGRKEAEIGRPFIGRSGILLRSFIASLDIKENEVYITSPVKYLPLSKTPSKEQIAHGRLHLLKQINVINPKVIILLGSVASLAVLQQKIPVKKMHGTIITNDNRVYFITLHPAAALRFPILKKDIASDFAKLKILLKSNYKIDKKNS